MKEIESLEASVLKQRIEVGKSKKAAKQLLVDLGIFHLLVPKGTRDKN